MKWIVLLIAATIATGCAPNAGKFGTVIPKAGGVFQVSSMAVAEDRATTNAAKAADITCKERGKFPAVEDVQTEYRGVLMERGSEGGKAATFGNRMLGRAPIPGLRSHDDYKVTMLFKCE